MQWRGLGVRTHHVHFKIVRRGGAGRNHGAQRRAISERIDKPRLGEEESGTVRFQAWRGPDRSPRVSGLDSDTPMRSLIRNERRINRYRSCPHERSGCQGMGQKTSDFSAIPLCAAHHRENPDSYHVLGEKEFSDRHGIDLKDLVLRLQSRFWQQDVSASRAVQAGGGLVKPTITTRTCEAQAFPLRNPEPVSVRTSRRNRQQPRKLQVTNRRSRLKAYIRAVPDPSPAAGT
jgi:hypothetical protein